VPNDLPLVKYWRKRAWKVHSDTLNDSSDLMPGRKRGRRGRTRSAQGINVTMLYIENADGTPINGAVAGEIREFACSIWRGLHSWPRSAAPEKWGDASKEVREQYYLEMETEFEVLRYCEGHWKAQAVATSIYSQWYSVFVKKRNGAVKEEDDTDEETVQATTKRPRVANSNDASESPSPQKDVAGMPKGITPIDPLYQSQSYRLIRFTYKINYSADVFDAPNTSGFTLLQTVPEVIPTPILDSGINGPPSGTGVTAPPTPPPVIEPQVAPRSAPIPVTLPAPPTTHETQMVSSSASTPEAPLIPETTHSNPTISINMPVGPFANSDPSLKSNVTPSSAATGNGRRVEKKYACNKKMIPGGAISAR